MPRVPKLPSSSQAWSVLAALADQADADQDVVTSDYVGPVPPRVFAAALLNLQARVAALENRPNPG